ncbi:restriction endonuclease [Kitasatospora sp. NPDC036755]|uniref:restriction endonuclease n=1 Tax=Kitasatospora sp. NPDC036755 TaxID=3154600 RepID=UPI0033CDB044
MARRPVRRRRSTAVRLVRLIRRARRNAPLAGAAALVVLVVALLVVQWMARHLLLVAALLVVAAVVGAAVGAAVLRSRRRADRRELDARTAQLRHIGPFLAMTPKAFEHALADLCRRDGCTKVKVVGGAGDLAADVLAVTPTGQRILIQAKRYGPRTFVGSDDVQKVNGTYRDVHRCDLAAVVTTSSFTKPAAAFCSQVGIRAVDQRALALWADGRGRPPWA